MIGLYTTKRPRARQIEQQMCRCAHVRLTSAPVRRRMQDIGSEDDSIRAMPLERRPALRRTNVRRTRKIAEKTNNEDFDEDETNCRTLERRVTRARQVRRTTLEENKAQIAALRGKRLFESALIVNIREEFIDGKRTTTPVVNFSFPEEHDDSVPPDMIFPDFSRVSQYTKSQWVEDENYMVSLTDKFGQRKNAYCIKYLPIYNEEESCSRFFYLDLVAHSLKYASSDVNSLQKFLESIYMQQYPERPGSCLMIVEKEKVGRAESARNSESRRLHRKKLALLMLYEEYTVCVIAALLAEQRVLITGHSVLLTSKAVQVFESLMRPLVWPHTFVPIIPDNLTDLCHNPTPYLMGILRSNLASIREIISELTREDFLFRQDFVLFDVDTGLMIPQPSPFLEKQDMNQWRTANALNFCEKVGMHKKLSAALIKALREALNENDKASADFQIDCAMQSWYAALFGHYRVCGCHKEWNDTTKKCLITNAASKAASSYLKYFTETIIFHEWIKEKIAEAKLTPSLSQANEDDTTKMENLWLAAVRSTNPVSPFSRMVNKMTTALHLSSRRQF
ncbi:unnamed protein product [Caenorhabditis auriculariae]|uniref:UDENN domain-containing protein n=1 Tax=Caenorhabditis auriculariae TaxID=2777116 RepID=A0A8S1HJE3_9PELO|nr:unnamed protein product [Caenorhabditis auriculariae]